MKYVFFIIAFGISFNLFSQPRWSSDPFCQKAFVENKGQFDQKNGKRSSAVSFGAFCEGVDVYFSSEGLTYRYDEYTLISKEERRKRKEEKEEEAVSEKPMNHFLYITWEGANPNVRMIAEESVPHFYTYPGIGGVGSLKALAYKKIIYKDLYPNIDVEYIFPDNKGGIKYSIVLRPGADASKIKMKYEGAKSVTLDPSGNVLINSSFGEFVDHAPQTFYANDKQPIPSSFAVKNSIVSFLISPSAISHLTSSIIVIDPWVTNPVFPGYNAAYDIEYDFAGNVYVYGGSIPYKEIKMNSAGTIQWIYTASLFTVAGYYGDFVVDAASGSSYLCEAYAAGGIGTRVAKINSLGAQVGMTPPDPRMQEMWRMVFDQCNRRPIIGGSSFTNPNNAQLCLLDTNMTGITSPSNVFGVNPSTSYNQDICMLAIDNSNNCFSSCCGNMFAKCAAPTLSPTAYVLPNNHSFLELSSVAYVMNNLPRTCGMNGMAASAKYVYTYDGGLIKRWNKNTGAFINGATLNATSFKWGGIAVDDCDNIFIGTGTSVVQYDTTFTVVSTIGSNGAVYDVRLGPGNILYTCGMGFVATSQLNLTSCATAGTLSVTVTATGSCSGQGSATASVSGGTAPYTYVWSPSGQTTSTATGLFAGTYTVTVTDNSFCPPLSKTETVTVVNTGGSMTIASAQSNILCNGLANGSATVTPTGGTTPITYLWSPAGGSGPTATGLAAGTYTATVTDASGCIVPQIVTITQPTPILITASSTSTTCTSNVGTATANVSGGIPVYTYSWSNGQSTSAAVGLAAGTYSVEVTDANGCTKTQTVSVSSGGGLVVNATSTQTGCLVSNGTATANATSGTTPYTYTWSNGQSTQIATGLAAGNYSVTVSDASGCVQTQMVTVGSAPGPVVIATASSYTVTLGSNSSLNSTGGITYQWTPAAGLSCTNCSNPVASPVQTTEYCVTVTDANGCSDSACVTITVDVPCGTIYIPNAFSPNGDLENDLECVMGSCIDSLHFVIYNRWGAIVFETTDQKICWDGADKKGSWFSDNPMNTAVFTYYLEATIKGNEKIIRQGNISLIR